jgi:hypothetical protein
MRTVTDFLRHNAIALLALFVALGGTSYAVAQLPKNSVKAKQIAPGAVGTSEVKDGSLLKTDFKAGQLPAGATGPQGVAGAPGQDGAPGEQGAPGRSALDTLEAGETVRGYVGGDFEAASAGGDWRVLASYPIPGSSAPGAVYIDGVTAGETCTGVASAPTAPLDTLCVYPMAAVNPIAGVGSHAVVAPNAFGFHVIWSPITSGDTLFRATYAYTQAAL